MPAPTTIDEIYAAYVSRWPNPYLPSLDTFANVMRARRLTPAYFASLHLTDDQRRRPELQFWDAILRISRILIDLHSDLAAQAHPRPHTTLAAIYRAMRKSPPMTIPQILKALDRPVTPKTRQYLSCALSHSVRCGRYFDRVNRGSYTLRGTRPQVIAAAIHRIEQARAGNDRRRLAAERLRLKDLYNIAPADFPAAKPSI